MQLIIVLERTLLDPTTITFVLRAAVPTARQTYFSDPTFVSAYKETPPADLTALRAGEYVERVCSDVVSGHTIAEIKTNLIAQQAAFQAEVTGQTGNPYRFYGTSWDGTTWTTGGVN